MKTTNIKDYLHLYLGCNIAISEERFNSPGLKMIGISDLGVQCRDEAIKLSWYVSPEDVKLILRPLSDMTGEEATKIGLIVDSKAQFSILSVRESDTKDFLFLLSKHFDLFGLIEAGLALDKTKLPTV